MEPGFRPKLDAAIEHIETQLDEPTRHELKQEASDLRTDIEYCEDRLAILQEELKEKLTEIANFKEKDPTRAELTEEHERLTNYREVQDRRAAEAARAAKAEIESAN